MLYGGDVLSLSMHDFLWGEHDMEQVSELFYYGERLLSNIFYILNRLTMLS